MGMTANLLKEDRCHWRLPKTFREGMQVDGLVFADARLMEQIEKDQALSQVVNVAFLPGIVFASLAMPDIHWGYGFPIGGVAATRSPSGVISPGGIGFDINCGVRLMTTNLEAGDVRGRMDDLMDALYANVPSGTGSTGRFKLKEKELNKALEQGARWAVKQGWGWEEDLIHTESQGVIEDADPGKVSGKARERGAPQVGTLGSGNHFLEVQEVEEIFDEEAAAIFGIRKGMVTVMIHTGSRGLGHQVATDYLAVMNRKMHHYGISVPDRQLCCAPLDSPDGRDYFAAMASAANFAWANRQLITHLVRESFEKVMRRSASKIGLHLLYDVAHNIAKIETHTIEGKKMKVLVHRKGATRAFGPGNVDVPEDYRAAGQPVIVPGDMGRYSFLLAGTKTAEEESLGSTCHGAGRRLSRSAAKKTISGRELRQSLEEKGITVRCESYGSLAEEAPQSYKDAAEVVDVTHCAGISRKVAKMRPLGVMKG
jgi:tRNA-splicing ligase RtcB